MRRAERLFRLVDEMRASGVVRADDLAERLEVSVRTIYRDVAHLQASGLPIDGEAGVGYLLRSGFDLPALTFTHDQVDALALGLSVVESSGDPVLAAAAREARAKLQASMPDPERRALADAPLHAIAVDREPARGAEFRRAIRERRTVAIGYGDAEGHTSERRLRPLVLWKLPDGWMVSGWCELREDFRTFRLDRIKGLTVTNERFQEDERRGARVFLEREGCGTRH